MNITESRKIPCEICIDRQGVLMPYCRDGDKEFFFFTCRECRDKVPYEVIPIKTGMDSGFFYCPNMPKNFDPQKGIFTRYGKKLLINKVRKSGVESLTVEERRRLQENGVEFVIMEDGSKVYISPGINKEIE